MSDPSPHHLPPSIEVGPFTYLVRTDLAAQAELSNAESVGLTLADRCEILISLEQAPQRMRATLLHEVLHACADLAGLEDDASEEEWASRLAPALLQVLTQNPRVLAYLVGSPC